MNPSSSMRDFNNLLCSAEDVLEEERKRAKDKRP